VRCTHDLDKMILNMTKIDKNKKKISFKIEIYLDWMIMPIPKKY